MYFPTIYSTKDHLVHIVKDEQICICKFPYHYFYSKNKQDLKKIKFKHLKEITCPTCRSNLKIASQVKKFMMENDQLEELDQEWIQIVEELMESNISKGEFAAFLDRKKGNL